MRITFVLPCYPWRPMGAFRVVYEYANQLVARGHEVAAVHARLLRHEESFWAPNGLYERLRSQVGRMRDAVLTPSISWCRIDERVRVLFVREPKAAFVPDADAVIAGAWGTAPYVLCYPDTKGARFHLLQSYAVTFGLPKPWVDAVWRAPIHNIVVSKWLYEIGRDLGISDITVIPNGINSSLFRLSRPIEGRPKTVAMMFSSDRCKGSEDALKAIDAAKKAHPDLRAVLFGIPPRTAEIPRWMEYHQNPPQERLVRDIYNSSSAFLCGSWSEGFALPPLEAMACGCAVVSTDCGGNRDYAEHEKTALLSPPRNPELLAQNLLRLLDDDALRLRLAKAGVERVRDFTWEDRAAQLEAFIQERVAAPVVPR